ncbi:hypothetical protein CDD82_2774 [Ophiocordyceps australis]|uniref:Uncharacterized protein n=1 Tax=Ophiocordyceps australis TaxID=1399860 RepID=A0A2C5ZGQ9_9HYPO|nr:hypothetical protein CDD82_2774 [Ophiocordyceps australis]
MEFLEDPRLRQRWNQITHDAETVTENAAAGIWSFQHNYINPCMSSIAGSIEQCTAVCLGDAEERRRRRRGRERQAEYSFDFYDDWYAEEQSGGLLGTWGGEDWDRLLAGTGAHRRHGGNEVATEQPRRKRGMSYGTRGGAARRKASESDPTIIPSTQPIGFLSKLPWKLGGTLRYKPSAADLQDRPGRAHEAEPLLGSDDGDSSSSSDYGAEVRGPRQRSGTTGSGDTSDSYRSRGDIFPSDGEGEEDAVQLDDEVTYEMVRNDHSSGKSGRTRSSKAKGKRRADGLSGSSTVSRTTLRSASSNEAPQLERFAKCIAAAPDADGVQRRHRDEGRLQQQEDEEVARKKEIAARLVVDRRLE